MAHYDCYKCGKSYYDCKCVDAPKAFPKDNEFKQDEVGVLHSTSDSALDGVRVRIVGMVGDYSPSYRIYAIERCDGNLWWTGYKVHGFTSRCIAKA